MDYDSRPVWQSEDVVDETRFADLNLLDAVTGQQSVVFEPGDELPQTFAVLLVEQLELAGEFQVATNAIAQFNGVRTNLSSDEV